MRREFRDLRPETWNHPAVPDFDRLGMVARWKPVHLGHAAVLRGLRRSCSSLRIGIGSAGAHDPRNPFTTEESEEMIRLVLGEDPDVVILPIPDLFDGPRWRALVVEAFGPLDAFVSANRWVAELLSTEYRVLHPASFVPQAERIPIEGRQVREALARGEDWESLVPPEIAAFLREEGLDERFRREFGLATLAEVLDEVGHVVEDAPGG